MQIFVAGHQLVSLNMLTGFVYEPLSTFNLLLGRDIRESSTVPWTEQLRKHDGDDVLCLPFSLSPFKLPEAARSLSLSGATVSHSFRFDPSSIHTTMVSLSYSCEVVAKVRMTIRSWRRTPSSCLST